MILECVCSPGLGQISYLLGDGDEVAVIDPCRDVRPYLEIAKSREARIRFVFETHRQQDLVSGALELGLRADAPVLHGGAVGFGYGQSVEHLQRFRLGNLLLVALETPGHSDESISIAVFETAHLEHAWGVFTGDTLLFGRVGAIEEATTSRPGRSKEMADKLYQSVFEKILALGDQALLFPAHGPRSTHCPGAAERPFSTLGYERQTNPVLWLDRVQFVEAVLAERESRPPYFRRVEVLNTQGPDMHVPAALAPRRPEELPPLARAGAIVVDLRSPEAFRGGHVPGSISLPSRHVAELGGWLLPVEKPLLLVAEPGSVFEETLSDLASMGYDRIAGYLRGGVGAWESSGRMLASTHSTSLGELLEQMSQKPSPVVIDVRTPLGLILCRRDPSV